MLKLKSKSKTLNLFALFCLGLTLATTHAQRFVKVVNTIDDLVRLNPNDVHTNVFVADAARGGLFVKAARATTNNGTMFMSTNASWQWNRRWSGDIDVKWFNAKGDGATDDADEINAAVAYVSSIGGGNLFFPEGEYVVNSQITLSDGVTLVGSGLDTTYLNFTASAATGAQILAAGSLTALPALGTNIVQGDRTITFASAPSVAEGDVIVIRDTDPFSYSPARSYYYQGEYFRVVSVSGNVVTVSSPAFVSYTAGADKALHKLNSVTVGARGMKMRFKTGSGVYGIRAQFGVGCRFEDLDLSGARPGQVFFDRCYESSAANLRIFDRQAAGADNYGIIVGNSQRIQTIGGFYDTTRHGSALGGSDGDACVVNREILYDGLQVGADDSTHGMDVHGNSEFVTIRNCILPAGLDMHGNNSTVEGCEIRNGGTSGIAIYITEMAGWNIKVANNKITALEPVDPSWGLVYIALNSRVNKTKDIFEFSDNTVDVGDQIVSGATFGLRAVMSPSATTDDVTVKITGNTFRSQYDPGSGIGDAFAAYGVYIDAEPGKGFERVVIQDNIFDRTGIRADENIRSLSINDNRMFKPLDSGIVSVSITNIYTNQVWEIDNNLILEARVAGINLRTITTNTSVYVTRNRPINGSTHYNADTQVANSFSITNAWKAVVVGNVFGDTRPTGSTTQLRVAVVGAAREIWWFDNFNIGDGLNNLTEVLPANAIKRSIVSDVVTYSHKLRISGSVGIGTATDHGTGVPLSIREDRDSASVLKLNNASSGTSARSGLGLFANDASAFIEIYPSTHSTARKADSLTFGLNSTASRMVFEGITPGQTLDFYAGGTTRTMQHSSGGTIVGSGTIDASAALQADSTTKGFLPPRMTEAQKNAIATPAEGLLVRQTDATVGLYEYRSGAWVLITASSSSSLTPTGTITAFAGSAAPSGYLPCDGAAVSRTTYAALFAVIGETWGVGDGTTTFNVPDLRGRTVIGTGTGAGLTARTLADTGGEETHVLTEAELPSIGASAPVLHNWGSSGMSVVDGEHRILVDTESESGTTFPYSGVTDFPMLTAGSDDPHNVMQPFAAVTYIIKI